MLETESRNRIERQPVAPAPTDSPLGIFTVVAIILLFWGFCWMKNLNLAHPPQHINIVFSDVAGLNSNAAVFVNGVKVGMVDRIEWLGESKVLVRIAINSSNVVVQEGSKYEILTNGIVGAKYVQIDLPHLKPGTPPPPAVSSEMIVKGETPVRPELAVNKLAITLSRIDTDKMAANFRADRLRFVRAADQLALLADKSMPVVDRTLPLMNDMSALTKDLRVTSKRISNILSNPSFSSDLKTTLQEAHETASILQNTIREINATLADKPLRADIVHSLEQLNQSSLSIEKSLSSLQSVTGDKSFRTDLMKIMQEAHATFNTVDDIVSKPMGAGVRSTLANTNATLIHLNLAAEQMNQILSKRSPLLHLMFGRPGKIKAAIEAGNDSASKASAAKVLPVKVPAVKVPAVKVPAVNVQAALPAVPAPAVPAPAVPVPAVPVPAPQAPAD